MADHHCHAVVLGVIGYSALDQQLGRVDHIAHRDHQTDFFSVVRSELPVDGKNARHGSEDAETEGAIRRRSSAHASSNDRDVQDRENQPAWRMPSDRGSDSGVYCTLLGAAGECGIAQCAVHLVDKGSLCTGSLLYSAGAYGRDHDHSNLVESDSSG